MPERKAKLLERIIDAVVNNGLATVLDARKGWPGFVDVKTEFGLVPLAVHVGTIGSSQRGRDDVERRFQNPGKGRPVLAPDGRIPVLLGLWEETGRPVLVAMDAQHRIGRATRQSLFVPLPLLTQAQQAGWAEQYSSSGELLIAFHPALLPIYSATVAKGIRISPREVETVLDASGLAEDDEATIEQRARRATTQLVRDADFGRRVCGAYGTLCSMCGFNFSLVQGAHIYPASAPMSSDAVWNGLALCHNHHAAFDRHRIFVEPESRQIALHPDLIAGASRNDACRLFVETTFPNLALPTHSSARPRAEMFRRRYEFFDPSYDWAVKR